MTAPRADSPDAVPPRLSARIASALPKRAHARAAPDPRDYADAAVDLLADLLARPTAGRESALDLLTVDALVTQVFEYAARTGEVGLLDVLAADAMRRTSALAGARQGSAAPDAKGTNL